MENHLLRASLIETYAALNLTAVAIAASPDGRRCRIESKSAARPHQPSISNHPISNCCSPRSIRKAYQASHRPPWRR
jgi:hypothetical protein